MTLHTASQLLGFYDHTYTHREFDEKDADDALIVKILHPDQQIVVNVLMIN